MKKLSLTALCLIPAMLFATCTLAGCGSSSNKLATPENFSFDVDSGKFKFDTVEGGEYYQITLSRRINEETYNTLKGNQRTKDQAATVQIDKNTTWYIWNENITSASRLQDKRSKGYIESSFSLRTYSNSASSAGSPVEFSTLAPGDYILQAIANETEEKEASDPYIYTFTKAGALGSPTGFTADINDDGTISIKDGSSYFYNALTSTGIPSKMTYEIKDGTTTLETITITDFAWTNSIQGPTNAFSFNNAAQTSTKKDYTKSKSFDYKVVITAYGDGATVTDASAEGTINHTYTVNNFDIAATKTVDGETVTYAGPDSFTIAFNVDDTDYTVNAVKAEAVGGAYLYYTFTDDKFGGSLEVKQTVSQGWGGETTSNDVTLKLGEKSLSGSFEIEEGADNAVTFHIKDVKAGGGGSAS